MRIRKISRKSADPEILRSYEEMRFERRYPKLMMLALWVRILGYGGIIPIFFLPEGARVTYLTIWMIFAGIAVVMELALMVGWQPSGRRLKALLLIIAVIGLAMLMMVGFVYAVGW